MQNSLNTMNKGKLQRNADGLRTREGLTKEKHPPSHITSLLYKSDRHTDFHYI